jgi:hypothetical protein
LDIAKWRDAAECGGEALGEIAQIEATHGGEIKIENLGLGIGRWRG